MIKLHVMGMALGSKGVNENVMIIKLYCTDKNIHTHTHIQAVTFFKRN
jgi:hypothetical protein